MIDSYTLSLEISLPKNKKNYEDQNENLYLKDRIHSFELRSSQDSYKRFDNKNQKLNTCTSEILNHYVIKSENDVARGHIGSIKQNNYFYQVSNDENESKQLNSRPLQQKLHPSSAIFSQITESEQVLNLKSENKKLLTLLEKSEKAWIAKLKESKMQTDKMMGIINKVWKTVNKQIVDRSQRRLYFDKNSIEEIELKRLLKENEGIRSRRESKSKLLDNIENILDLWFTKLMFKQDSDR